MSSNIPILVQAKITFGVLVCFKIFDMDKDGVLNHKEVTQLIDSLNLLAEEQFIEESSETSQLQISDLMNEETAAQPVTLESFPIWATKKNSLKNLLNLLHQVQHNTCQFFCLNNILFKMVSCAILFLD